MSRLTKVLTLIGILVVWLVSMGGWFVLGRIAFLNATEKSPPTLAPRTP